MPEPAETPTWMNSAAALAESVQVPARVESAAALAESVQVPVWARTPRAWLT